MLRSASVRVVASAWTSVSLSSVPSPSSSRKARSESTAARVSLCSVPIECMHSCTAFSSEPRAGSISPASRRTSPRLWWPIPTKACCGPSATSYSSSARSSRVIAASVSPRCWKQMADELRADASSVANSIWRFLAPPSSSSSCSAAAEAAAASSSASS